MTRAVAPILRTASVLLAVLVGLLLGITSHAPSAAVAVDAPPASLAHTYDGDHMSVGLTCATTERGPPTYDYTTSTALDAVDRSSRGPSARSAAPTLGDAISYDRPALLAQSARTAGTTMEQVRQSGGHLRAVQRWHVAAKSAIRVRPPVSVPKGQFGSKFGKHASDYGLDVGDSAARASYMARIRNVHRSPDEVRMGQYGAYDDAFMFRQGNDLLIARSDGTFVSLYPGAQTSSWFKNAPVFPH